MRLNIPGAKSVIDWFGRWPSFYDAEIMTLHIDREQQASCLRIRAFTTSDQTGSSGRFIRDREALDVFEFARIRSVRIEGEDADVQNVISSLLIEQTQDGYRLLLGPCYGIAGEIVVKDLKVRLESSSGR